MATPDVMPELKDKPLADSLSQFQFLQPEGSRFLLGQWLQLLPKDDLYRLSSAYELIMSQNADTDSPLFKEISWVAIFAYCMEMKVEELDISLEEVMDLVRKLSLSATIQCLNREGAVFLPSDPLSIDPDVQDNIGFEPFVIKERLRAFQEIPGFDFFVAPAVEATFNASRSVQRH